MAIQSFKEQQLKDFMEKGIPPKNCGWKSVRKVAIRKLDMLHYAKELSDLNIPPGNRLESIKGDLINYYSLRINAQWRIIFRSRN